ncbi:hypothetical protein [Chryseobacterium jejuense]|uniref:hypothetical protein n=1 Tax=Chryseobacterium jejuense TaxID=445960 RepID=UPI001AE7C7EF|nr:hypothetical protein [Chryseobacterium jejuense]MBP2614938.1 hypothetical protein [Chryseobacterium jejuense]
MYLLETIILSAKKFFITKQFGATVTNDVKPGYGKTAGVVFLEKNKSKTDSWQRRCR